MTQVMRVSTRGSPTGGVQAPRRSSRTPMTSRCAKVICRITSDDGYIGEEVRRVPVDNRNGRYFIMLVVIQDHTYFEPPPEQNLIEPPPVAGVVAASISAPTPVATPPATLAGSTASTFPTQSEVPANSTAVPVPLIQMSLISLVTYSSSVIAGETAAAGGSISPAPATAEGQHASFDYIHRRYRNSLAPSRATLTRRTTIWARKLNRSRKGRASTNPSVYASLILHISMAMTMICCDKCSARQYVGCKGINRMNILDEYNFEMCQPRKEDRKRARMLQLEQSLFLANNNLQQMQQQPQQVGNPAVTSTNLINVPVTTTSCGVGTGSSGKGANQYPTGKALASAK